MHHSSYMCVTLTHISVSEHVAPPKKPPRPGAPAHLTNLSSLCPVDSYNEGVKVWIYKTQLHVSYGQREHVFPIEDDKMRLIKIIYKNTIPSLCSYFPFQHIGFELTSSQCVILLMGCMWCHATPCLWFALA